MVECEGWDRKGSVCSCLGEKRFFRRLVGELTLIHCESDTCNRHCNEDLRQNSLWEEYNTTSDMKVKKGTCKGFKARELVSGQTYETASGCNISDFAGCLSKLKI